MDYNKFNIEEKYDSYSNISLKDAERILIKLEEASKQDEMGYDYYILRGKMLLKLGRMDEAFSALKRALDFKTSDEVYDLLSFAYYQIEDYENALYYINRSFGINVDEYVYNHKGKILEQLGRLEEAFDVYYNGLKFVIDVYASYGDVEIFGENVFRVGAILKNNYTKCINQFIKKGDYYNLYDYYMKLLQVTLKEEENDHFHSGTGFQEFKCLELIEAGKYILIDNDYFIEMVNIYKLLYDIEKNCEYEDKDYISRAYIDKKVKELVDDIVERTSLVKDENVILQVLDEVINLKNSNYYDYLYHKGFIYMKLKKYDMGINVLDNIIVEDKCAYLIKVQSHECIIKSLEDENGQYEEICEKYKKDLTDLLLKDIERLKAEEYISLDAKTDEILKNCTRAINLSLDNEFWIKTYEDIALEYGEKYEISEKNKYTYKMIENYNKAINIYDMLIKINKNCAHGYYRKGRAIVLVLRLLNSSKTELKEVSWVHNLDCFSYSEVIYNLNKAISLRDNNGKYFNLLARTHFEIGEYEKANQYMERALQLSPKDLYMNLNVVCVYIRRYQYTEAVDYLFRMPGKDLERGTIRKTFLPRKEILSFLMGIFNIYQRQDRIYYIIAYYFYGIVDFQPMKAITFINKAIDMVDDERYYLLKAKIYFKENNYSLALKSAEEALGIDEHYDEAHTIKEACNNELNKRSSNLTSTRSTKDKVFN